MPVADDRGVRYKKFKASLPSMGPARGDLAIEIKLAGGSNPRCLCNVELLAKFVLRPGS